MSDANRYRFDQACRVKAVMLASELRMSASLSINFMPNAVYRPELCIRTTLQAGRSFSFPVERMIFEITEGEKVEDHAHLREILQYYKQRGRNPRRHRRPARNWPSCDRSASNCSRAPISRSGRSNRWDRCRPSDTPPPPAETRLR